VSPVAIGLLAAIRLYQFLVSPAKVFLFGPGAGCRYIPSWSAYAAEAIRCHGAGRGSSHALRRLCRCHPWGGFGYDPVPPAPQP
jgi:hypothetical protein